MSERGRKEPVERKRQGIVPPQAPKRRMKICPCCEGYKWLLRMPYQIRYRCPLCNGTGKIKEDSLRSCLLKRRWENGEGARSQDEDEDGDDTE